MKTWRDYAAAPAPGFRLCAVAELPEDGARVFDFRDGQDIVELFVVRRDGHLVAYVNDCPHTHTPLDWQPGEFFNRDRSLLMCATHGALFRIADGLCLRGPCKGKSLVTVPLDVRDGDLLIAAE